MTSVRPATHADAVALGRVHVAAWREAYANLLSAEFLAGLSVERRVARWELIIADTSSGHVVRIAEADGNIVGVASSGPCRDDDARRPLELYSLYLLAAHYGSGLGQQLLDATLGHSPATLWVAQENPRAQAFYRRTWKTSPISAWFAESRPHREWCQSAVLDAREQHFGATHRRGSGV